MRLIYSGEPLIVLLSIRSRIIEIDAPLVF